MSDTNSWRTAGPRGPTAAFASSVRSEHHRGDRTPGGHGGGDRGHHGGHGGGPRGMGHARSGDRDRGDRGAASGGGGGGGVSPLPSTPTPSAPVEENATVLANSALVVAAWRAEIDKVTPGYMCVAIKKPGGV